MDVTPNVGTVSEDGKDFCIIHELVFDAVLDRKERAFFGHSKTVTIKEIKRYLVWIGKTLEEGHRYVLELDGKRISVKSFISTLNLPGFIAYEILSDFEEKKG